MLALWLAYRFCECVVDTTQRLLQRLSQSHSRTPHVFSDPVQYWGVYCVCMLRFCSLIQIQLL